MNMNLFKDAKITRVSVSVVAGTTLVTGTPVDMQGFDSVAFIALLGDVTNTSVLTLTGLGNDTNDTVSPLAYPDVATFTADATSADNKMLGLDIQKPRERYVYPTLTRATANAVVDAILAIQYNSQNKPLADAVQSMVAFTSMNDPAGA